MRIATALLLTVLFATPASHARPLTDDEVHEVVTQEMQRVPMPGAAVAIRIDGRTLFFNSGVADLASRRPVTSDSLFNLASVSKVFDVTLLSLLIKQGRIAFDDSVAKHVEELQQGGDIRQVTLGQLATFTSGFSLPQDHPPWPVAYFTLPKFLDHLRTWKRDKDHQPGKQYVYSHAGFMLLHLALERRFGTPYGVLLERELLRRFDLSSSMLPLRDANSVAMLAPSLLDRAVQGYSWTREPIGTPGDMQGYYHWPGTGQMFSSARDLAAFLAAQMGELPLNPLLRDAIALTHQEVAPIHGHVTQAQAWEIHRGPLTIIDKNGGLNNTTTYIGMVPRRRLGMVILINRGGLNGRDFGHAILLRLALPESSSL